MLFSFQGGKKLHLHGSCGITWSKALKAAYLPHSGSQAEPHPGAGSPSGRQDAGSEGYLLQSSCSSANHLARPADSHSWRSWPVSYWERVRIKQTVRAIKPQIKARRVSVAGSYRVDRVWRVSKAPGVIVVSWLSYRDNRRTLWSPVKLSLWIQLILLFLNILMTKEIHINKKKTSETFPNMDKYGVVTHNIRSPSRPRNIPLRTESIWLAVRWSSLTEDAPSNAPSSISVILLLLRLLCVCGGRKKACRRIKSSTYSLESDCWKVRGFLLTFSSAGKGS